MSENVKEKETEDKSPTTPERKKYIGERVPKTPPNQSFNKFNNIISPTENSDSFLPPATPSSSLNYQAQSKYKISNIPQTPSSSFANNVEQSPLKSPQPELHEEEDKKPPIREISSALKTRLSYAFVKVQKDWTNQSLDELEKNITHHDDTNFKPDLNKPKTSPSKIIKPVKSPQRKIEHSRRKLSEDEDEEDSDDGSANAAFLQAISKTRSPKRRQNNFHQPLVIEPLNNNNNPEADAIQTLMSLSSPQSFKHELISPTKLPRQRLSFGEKSSPTNNDETDIETDVESDTDKNGIKKIRKIKKKLILTNESNENDLTDSESDEN